MEKYIFTYLADFSYSLNTRLLGVTSGKLGNGEILATCSNGNYLDLSCKSEISGDRMLKVWMALTPS